MKMTQAGSFAWPAPSLTLIAVSNCSAAEQGLNFPHMKRYLQLYLFLLISFALPLSGMAGVQSPSEPCPMKTTGMAKMVDMDKGCCHDMGGPSDHGKPCKPGLECKTISVLQVAYVKPAGNFTSPIAASNASDFLPERTPSGVWRPPRA